MRLVYAPHGESSGSLTFRIKDMAAVDGRRLLDAFVMLLSVRRFFAVAREHQLPALLADSRRRILDPVMTPEFIASPVVAAPDT